MSRVPRWLSPARLTSRGPASPARRSRSASFARAAFAAAVVVLSVPSLAAAAPAKPTGLQVNATGPQQVALTWTAGTAGSLNGYHVYRNGALIATLDQYSPNYLDQSSALVNGTSYTYTVTAYDGTGDSPVSTGATGAPVAAPTTLMSCDSTTRPAGHYLLGADVTAFPGGPCFSFAPGSNTTLDCQGHSITQNGTYDVVDVNTVDKFIFSHCVFKQLATSGKVATVTNGSYGVFTDDTFTGVAGSGINNGALIDLDHSPHAVIGQIGHGDTFTNTGVETHYAVSTYEGHNAFTEAGGVNVMATWFNQSNGSTAVYNHVDGGYTPATKAGLDDGWLLAGPNDNMTVSSNTIAHTFDALVESGGTLTNSHLDHNTASYVAYAGIGAYHDTDFRNNTIIGNQVDHAPHLIMLKFDGSYPSIDIVPPSFNLSGNAIVGNTLTSEQPSDQPGANQPGDPSAVLWNNVPPAPWSPATSTGNVVSGNDFGPTDASIDFTPSTATIYAASTGNYCKSSVSIQCIGKPIITAGSAPERNSNGSYILRALVDASGANTTLTQIQYGLTTSYGSTASSLPVTRGTPTQIPGFTGVLTPGATYHYRGVATNAYGTTYGPDQTFTAS
jgi:hypothetical protein